MIGKWDRLIKYIESFVKEEEKENLCFECGFLLDVILWFEKFFKKIF